MNIRIVRDYQCLNIFRQTPGGNSRWGSLQFSEEPTGDEDLLVILNRTVERITTSLPRHRIWTLSHEPPVRDYRIFHQMYRQVGLAVTPDTSYRATNVYHSHGAIPWHSSRSFDFFASLIYPEKTGSLSCITSDKAGSAGAAERYSFIRWFAERNDIRLFGRGINPIADKADAHLPYRFSIVMENCRTEYYWSEKIVDSLLNWSFPIYSGASRIGDYLPSDSFLAIDISNPEEAEGKIRKKLAEGLTERNLAAMAEARELVLERYQLFPFIAGLIKEHGLGPRNANRVPEFSKSIIRPVLRYPERYPRFFQFLRRIRHTCTNARIKAGRIRQRLIKR